MRVGVTAESTVLEPQAVSRAADAHAASTIVRRNHLLVIDQFSKKLRVV
jgi:hypothetical protein